MAGLAGRPGQGAWRFARNWRAAGPLLQLDRTAVAAALLDLALADFTSTGTDWNISGSAGSGPDIQQIQSAGGESSEAGCEARRSGGAYGNEDSAQPHVPDERQREEQRDQCLCHRDRIEQALCDVGYDDEPHAR